MRTFLRTPVVTYPTQDDVGLIFDFLDKKLVFAPVCDDVAASDESSSQFKFIAMCRG